MSRAYYDAAAAASFTAKLTDTAGAAVAFADLQTLTLTLRNPLTGLAINTRDNQNVKAGSAGVEFNDVKVDATSGQMDWAVQAADVPDPGGVAVYAAEFKFTASVGGLAVSGSLLHELVVLSAPSLLLCTVDDVEYHLGRTKDADLPHLLREILAVSRRCESYTARLFKRVVGETQQFSRQPFDRSVLYLQRFPVEEVTEFRESATRDFTTAGAYVDVATSEYGLNPGGRLGRQPAWIRFDDERSVDGTNVLQVKYTGGLWRETSAVDMDMRDAVGQQVAFRFQRRGALGVSGMSAGQGGSVSFGNEGDTGPFVKYERDVLAAVRAVWDDYRAFHPTF